MLERFRYPFSHLDATSPQIKTCGRAKGALCGAMTPPPLDATDLEALLLHRDGLILIVNKPAGLPVHRGPQAAGMKGVQAFEDYFDHYRFGLPRRPALAHRLDRDTSGCLVLGRHHKATERLGKLFKQGAVEKTYLAVVEGAPPAESGVIDAPLGRRDETRGWWMKVDPAGLPAQTNWRALARFGGPDEPLTLLELKPLTGRTHQLRVHCAHLGFPILGDNIYGRGNRFAGPRLHLHARSVIVPMQASKEPVRATAPLPPHIAATLQTMEAAQLANIFNDAS
jgi:tRNA pseudouridine32 synthase/23S rRNA pseudouridine746 synthase